MRLERLWSAVDLRESIDASTSYEATVMVFCKVGGALIR